MTIDPFILGFSAVTVAATIWMGFWAARKSKTAHDFFVAGRNVSVGWNASAISGEYLSAASFMGVAGMVMSSGYDALWYPVCYACGYLFLLLFIAGPLRRFGAYTIPDFAEGRYDSPVFRKIAVVFVLFIGFFYTMPQMKGAGTTLAYIFPGLNYRAGVILMGCVITLNVALGGMKGITLVQAFQYWMKMFAISAPMFVLMLVYGDYGKQLGANGTAVNTGAGLTQELKRAPLPDKAPVDESWLAPFGPLTSKPAKAAATAWAKTAGHAEPLRLRADLTPESRLTVGHSAGPMDFERLTLMAEELTGRQMLPRTNHIADRLDDLLHGQLSRLQLVKRQEAPDSGLRIHRDGIETAADVLQRVNALFATNGVTLVPLGTKYFRAVETAKLAEFQKASVAEREQIWLKANQRPFSLIYTYSLIIALVCGTAGLPHILVRFYTNPDGRAAKRTTMWVMILIGVFYLFPPMFGVLGRNVMPDLYAAAGAKGTDKIVLELPRILNERFAPWGSVLSGITCAGAFAAFMSTFSGLLVSMTGALAHDVYGRMLKPAATQSQRLAAFRICAVLVGAIAIVFGMQVEPFQINFMVGQAFAIAAASYFPLLFMSTWWRGMTMKGAACGMLTGGLLALTGITLTSFSDLKWLPLGQFWALHPLLRILCEQPAIWTVPLAIALMVLISKWTRSEIPSDVRMKMLVLHAPEKLGLKQEYIQERDSA